MSKFTYDLRAALYLIRLHSDAIVLEQIDLMNFNYNELQLHIRNSCISQTHIIVPTYNAGRSRGYIGAFTHNVKSIAQGGMIEPIALCRKQPIYKDALMFSWNPVTYNIDFLSINQCLRSINYLSYNKKVNILIDPS